MSKKQWSKFNIIAKNCKLLLLSLDPGITDKNVGFDLISNHYKIIFKSKILLEKIILIFLHKNLYTKYLTVVKAGDWLCRHNLKQHC